MGKLTLILGGARSGKSSFAELMAGEMEGRVIYIATAQALDDEMRSRILKHQKDRPADWQTLELPRDIGGYWLENQYEADSIILDCLTLLVNNLLMAYAPDEDHPDEKTALKLVEGEIRSLLNVIEASSAHWILVTNEVGLGLVPPYPLGRVYRDLLGFTNQQVASQADQVYWMVAGIPVPIHQFRNSSV